VHWQEGRGELFDDTFLHYVHNDTDEYRMVLFLDVEKPINNWLLKKIVRKLNKSSLPRLLSLVNSKNEKGNKTESN